MSKTFAQPRLIGAAVFSLALTLAAALLLAASSLAAPGPIALAVTPSPASFPKTTVGEKSPLEIDVFNEGEEATIEKIVIEGGDQSDFSSPGNSCGILAEGQHCSISIAFGPGSVGEKHSTAFIRFSGGARPEESFELTGTGVVPHLSFTPPSHDFGVQRVNSEAESTTFQLQNDGEGPVRINSIDFTNDESFWIGNSDCLGRLVQAAETCSIQVRFGPNNTGSYSTELRVNAGGEFFTAELSGEGARAEVEASPNPADFGAATVGSLGATRTITLTNSGRVPNGFFIAIVSGGDSASFRLLDENCTGHQLAPAATCTARIRFAPAAAGPLTATLSFFGEGDGPLQMPIRGEGVAATATVSPTAFDFGSQAIGTKGPVHSFAIRNEGDSPIELGIASIVGLDLDQFALAGDTCAGTMLGAGEECLLRVRFAPDLAGAHAATLRVGGEGVLLSASLSGAGVAQPATLPRVSFRWRQIGRSLRRGTILSAGTASCHLAEHCKVTVRAQVNVVRHPRAGLLETQVARLPRFGIRFRAHRSRPVDIRLPGGVRALLGHGRAKLLLDVSWKADGETGHLTTSTRLR